MGAIDSYQRILERKETLVRGYIVWIAMTKGDCWELTLEGLRAVLGEWITRPPELRQNPFDKSWEFVF